MMKKKHLRPLHQRCFSYVSALFYSFFSSSLSIDVALRWRGIGALYLLMMVFLTSMPFIGRLTWDLHHYLEDTVLFPLRQIPTLAIDNGNFLPQTQMPVVMKNQAGDTAGIFSTTGDIQHMLPTHPHLFFFITLDKIQFRFPPFAFYLFSRAPQPSTMIHDVALPAIQQGVFDSSMWLNSWSIRAGKWVIISLFYMAMFGVFYGWLLMNVLILAFLGQAIATIFFKFSLNYAPACRLLALASTPPCFLLFIYFTLGAPHRAMGLLVLVLMAFYYCLSIMQVGRHVKKKGTALH